MARRTTEYMLLDELAGNERNPKGHDLPQIGASMKRFGYTEPVMVDERTGLLVSGHGRVEQMRLDAEAGKDPPEGVDVADDGKWLVPVTRGWRSANDMEANAYLIAANQLTIRGGWLQEPLTDLLVEIAASTPSLEGIGFEPLDVEALLQSISDRNERNRSEPPPDVEPKVIPPAEHTARGDVWIIGPHRVMCGDSKNAADVATLIGEAKVNVAVTSPPYADRRDYDAASGFEPIPAEEYVEWFAPVAANVAEHLADDGSWFVNIKAGAEGLDTNLYVLDLVIAHARSWGWHYATEFCWERGGVPKHVTLRFKNQFESVYQFARGHWKIRPDNVRHWSDNAIVPLGYDDGERDWAGLQGSGRDMFRPEQKARPRKGLTDNKTGWSTPEQRQGQNWAPGDAVGGGWAYPGNRLHTFAGTHEATGHAAAFPVGLPEWFVRAYSDVGDVVFDPFLGSGSTVIAAHHSERVGLGMELSANYAEAAARRIAAASGLAPVKASDGAALPPLAT